jgi:cytochrome P450
VIAEILGLPRTDCEKFVDWTIELFIAAAADNSPRRSQVTDELVGYLARHVGRQRTQDMDSLITTIRQAKIDGRPLSQSEQLGLILSLVTAGHATTVGSIGTMLYYLAAVSGLRERLIDQPELTLSMVAESLRIESPVIALGRVVQEPATLAGKTLCEGERLLMVFNAANRDPAVFDQPTEFVCPRGYNPHLAFGYGIHRCLGEHLALLEMRVVAEEVLRIIPDYRLIDGYHPQWIPGRIVRSLATLPVTFGSSPLGQIG